MSDHPLPPVAPESALRRFLRSRVNLAACLALAALGVYLLATHTGHVLAAVPYLVLVACPLLHLFMHRGHGHGK
ncbi:MAG: DUF2933 domain-containing protein [Salinarimonas sp.]